MLHECLSEDFDYLTRDFESCADDKFMFFELKEQTIKGFNKNNLRDFCKNKSFTL